MLLGVQLINTVIPGQPKEYGDGLVNVVNLIGGKSKIFKVASKY